MSLLTDIFKSPFTLVDSSSRDYGEPISNLKFEFKTDDIFDTTTKEIIFNISKRHFDDLIVQYKNYILNGEPTTESTNVSLFKDEEWEFKHIYSISLDHESDSIGWENKYDNNTEIEGEFYIGIDVIVYVSPEDENENRYEEDYDYKLKKSITEDECVLCCDNKANILYTECLHFVVCDVVIRRVSFLNVPYAERKLKTKE